MKIPYAVIIVVIVNSCTYACGMEKEILEILAEQRTVETTILDALKTQSYVGDDMGRGLRCAAMTNNFNIVKLLLDKNVDVNDADEDNLTALHFSAYFGYHDVTKFLVERNANPNIKSIVDCGATPLFYAVMNNWFDVVHMLIAYGADVNLPHDHGKASHITEYKENVKMITALYALVSRLRLFASGDILNRKND